MRRPPTTIVILAWNAWDQTKACLGSLRSTLGVRDQVIVVDNGSTDATPIGLRHYPWLQVVTNTANRGFAGGCNQGAALAEHDTVVFLNNDTVLTGHWLDALLKPFEDPAVVASGPRSNFVSGPQLAVEASYSSTDMAAMRRFARQWAESHRGQTADVDRLVGFCLAVRRSVFDEIGGFDEGYAVGGFEDDDLCRRLAERGLLVVAHESFVHHAGHKTFDANGLDWIAHEQANQKRFEAKFGNSGQHALLSACLITKDEEDNLPSCLASLREVVDEVVVYDTGSTDKTVALARQLGATVIEGYWDDDFARARNAALAECHGEWIAWLDADETLVCDDPIGLRDLMRRTKPDIDAWWVAIDNLTGAGVGAGFVHHAARLFRRTRCEWVGRLHEQIALQGTHMGIRQAVLESARIRHTGYLDSVMRARNKADRNLRLAEREVEEADGWERGYSLTSLGRSYMTAGRVDDAIARCTEALDHSTNPITRRLAIRTVAEAHLIVGRLQDAADWIDRLRRESDSPVQADVLQAKLCLAHGDATGAHALLQTLPDGAADDDGFEYTAAMLAPLRAEALAGVGDVSAAADTLLAALGDAGVLDAHIGTAIDYLLQAGRPLTDLVDRIPPERTQLFLAQVLQLRADAADAVLEAWWERAPDKLPALAAAATAARGLPLDRMLVWSARLRTAGQQASCPLVTTACDPLQPIARRAYAAATAVRAFGDRRGTAAYTAAIISADSSTRATIAEQVRALCPDLAVDGAAAAALGTALTGTDRHCVVREAGDGPWASIIIPCFNMAQLTLQCLQSLRNNTEAGTYEVVIVDNASTDATSRLADLAGKDLLVIRNETNLGFARACNQGAAAASGRHLVFLNNDTVALPGWLPALLAPLEEDPAIGVVGARLLFPDGTIQHAGVEVIASDEDGKLRGSHLGYGRTADDAEIVRPGDVSAVTGAAMAVRRNTWEATGGFHEGYWNGNEDVDFCLLARKLGWRVRYQPAAVLFHFESRSGSERWTEFEKNVELLNNRWADSPVAI